MYRKLQEKVREYIIDSLCQIPDKWKFDIDMEDKEKPIIVGYGPNDVVVRAPIEEFKKFAVNEGFSCGMKKLYNMGQYEVNYCVGCSMVRQFRLDVFKIYGVNIYCFYNQSLSFEILSKNGRIKCKSYAYANGPPEFISPFLCGPFNKYVIKEELVSPFLLLLDSITYFRKYSAIIHKYPELNGKETLGIYEILLEYFPEMDGELFGRYLLVCCVFQDVCSDVGSIVLDLLISLWLQKD